ncbi:MAG: Gfo/Idh/MocA family oxidoreductase [Propionicimonas sp.]|uniref:Gfo/Idh/MocA family protein n=1 Tax=Propionicimonas sp. TaxID=1955623 RepID=UPI003D139ED9
MTVRWGIAGPGRIAATMAAEFAHVPDAELVAVGSRSADRAQLFADRYGIPRAFGSYDELFASDVDAIYLATPHAQHTELALAAIAAGKALLVEKSFTATVEDTAAIIDASRTRGVFVMEAMWTRFLPAITHLRGLVASGALGEVRSVYGDLLAFREFDPSDRLFNPALGGGAVLDLGVYVISFAQQFLGTPEVVHAVGGVFPNGVEAEAGILLGWPDGRYSTQAIGFTAPGPGRQVVAGTKGWVEVKPRFHRAEELSVHLLGEPAQELVFPKTGTGYSHELAHVCECLADRLTESPVMPLADTLAVQQVMAEVLSQLGR